MRYAQIRKMDISNGEGIGVSLFTQGCPIRCKGCHNSSIWDFDGGYDYTRQDEQLILDLMSKEYISRFSLLGGEVLLKENMPELSTLCLKIKSHWPQKKIWLWSGYLWEEIYDLAYGNAIQIGIKTKGKQTGWTLEDKANLQIILENIDILVDGPFIQEQKDITLKWCGSSNQRLISVPTTLSHGLGQYPVLYCE